MQWIDLHIWFLSSLEWLLFYAIVICHKAASCWCRVWWRRRTDCEVIVFIVIGLWKAVPSSHWKLIKIVWNFAWQLMELCYMRQDVLARYCYTSTRVAHKKMSRTGHHWELTRNMCLAKSCEFPRNEWVSSCDYHFRKWVGNILKILFCCGGLIVNQW